MIVKLFGIAAEIAGARELNVSGDISTVKELRLWLTEKLPELPVQTSFAVAVNNEYAEDDQPLEIHNEIAIIPPVSGG